MKGKKYLVKNIGLLTVSQFGTKLLSFFLVPLYTNILTTEEYGIYDLFHTTILLLVPFLTMNISDATLRFPLDNKNHSAIFSISLKHVLRGILAMAVLLGLNHMLNCVPMIDQYWVFIFAMYVASSVSGIFTNFARGIDGIREIAIGGIICFAVLLSLNIIFLVPMHLGLNGYFLANILGSLAQSAYLSVALKFWKYADFRNGKEKSFENEMIVYSRPLIANNIAWWVNSFSDRYIVTWLCGYATNGIYAVGYKIPSILNVFQTIFNQAWTLSAVKDFDPEDKNGFFTDMYNLYNFFMICICSMLIISTRICAKILYAKDFYEAWIYVPLLLMSILFGALSGYLGGIFAAVKDTKIFAQTTVMAAVVNTILNVILIYFVGPIGAAIATLIAYWLTWFVRIIRVRKYIRLRLNYKRDVVAYLLLLLQSIILYVLNKESVLLYGMESLILVLILVMFREQVKYVLRRLNRILRSLYGRKI